MNALTVALLLAIVALGFGVVAVLQERRGGSKVGVPALVLVVGPAAGIIGIAPGVLHLSETVRVIASLTSIVMSLGVIAVLAAHLIRRRHA